MKTAFVLPLLLLIVITALCQDQYPAQHSIPISQTTMGSQTGSQVHQQPKTTEKTEVRHVELNAGPTKGVLSSDPLKIGEVEKKIVDLWNKRWNVFERVFKSPTFWPFKGKTAHDLLQGDLFDELEGLTKAMDWEPRAELIESRDTIKINVELPGVQKNDVTIELKTTPDNQRDILHIRGIKKAETLKSNEKHYIHEVSFGQFDREWVFAKSRIVGSPTATLNNGVLSVQLPKRDIEETKPKIVSIPISEVSQVASK